MYPILGKMYGTIAQNYGFCGPGYLEKTEEFVIKAQDAFGGGKEPGLKEDWLREFNYLVYAYLDAGEFSKAEEALRKYLEIDSTNEVLNIPWDRWNRFQHAALARFVAETGKGNLNEYFLRMYRAGSKPGRDHPWQLWFFNAGRAIGGSVSRELVRELWRKSLDVAFRLRGPGRAMALLPLAWLYAEGLEDEGFLKRKTEDVLEAIKSTKHINRNHFEKLLTCRSFREVLEEVKKSSSVLFPFSYR